MSKRISAQQLKGAGIALSALLTAERKISKYESAFRRILRLLKGEYIAGPVTVRQIETVIERVYKPKRRA